MSEGEFMTWEEAERQNQAEIAEWWLTALLDPFWFECFCEYHLALVRDGGRQ